MPSDLISMWALTVGAVLVHLSGWIALAVLLSALLRLKSAGRRVVEGDKYIAALNEIKDALGRVVIFSKAGRGE